MFDIRLNVNEYPKDSIDRFGDDLTEEVLQYLTFIDKARFECVSKQWQRCIYKKQTVLEIPFISDNNADTVNRPHTYTYTYTSIHQYSLIIKLNKRSLKSLLKKCSNIIEVDLKRRVDSDVLSLIGQYCPNIRSLTHYSCEQNDLNFYRYYGHKLEELTQYGFNEKSEHCLKLCPNLKKIDLMQNSILFNEDEKFLPNLQHPKNIFIITCEDVNKMKIFFDKYSTKLMAFGIWFSDMTPEVKTCFECVSRLENLRQLKIGFLSLRNVESLRESLSLIGQKCTKLSKFDLQIYSHTRTPISIRFFAAFTEFKAINKLKIDLFNDSEVKGSVAEYFDKCLKLKRLELSCNQLTEDFFANIQTVLPNITFLSIYSHKSISELFIVSLQTMKCLQRVVVNGRKNREYCFGKCFKKFKDEKNVKQLSNNCGLILDD